MFKNNLFIALRHFQKQKFASFVNIAGLTIAITTCVFLFLYVYDEFQYDGFQQNKERVVRLIEQSKKTGEKNIIWPAVYFPRMISETPEIEKGFRLIKQPEMLIANQAKRFYDDLYFADKEILDMLTFPLLRGNKNTSLSESFAVVITEDIAKKYFGNENPVGKILRIENQYDLKVTGVLKNIPIHSHIKPNIIASISTLETVQPSTMKETYISSCIFYFMLKKNIAVNTVEKKLHQLAEQIAGKETASQLNIILEPLNKIYLDYSNMKWDYAEHGDIDTVKSFILIAALIMLMACFNYTNLLTTLVKIRDKELAVRKLLGAGRESIILQFLYETILFWIISLFAALASVAAFINEFNQITGKKLVFSDVFHTQVFVPALLLLCLTALLSIIYPSFVALKSDSLYRLKGAVNGWQSRISKFTFGFRQLVTGFQFAITSALIVAVIVIYGQMLYASNAKLGFNKEQLLAIDNPWGEKMYERYQILKNKLTQYPQFQAVSASENIPGRNINNFCFARLSGKPVNENVHVAQIAVDYGLFKTWQAKILAGRDFSEKLPSDGDKAVIINKAAAAALGLKNPVGSFLSGINNASDNQQVIGVVDDINFKSFKEEVPPIIFYLRQWSSSSIVVRLKTSDISKAISIIEKEWNGIMPEKPLYYAFVDDLFNKFYISETRTAKLISIFCTLAIIIALIGLLGLITLISQIRQKEIGIRKVLGASVTHIISMMTREYLYIIIAANVVAFPVAYYFLSEWLQRFIYRIEMSFWMFILAGVAVFLIGLSAIVYKIIRAATANPVDTLRYE